MSSLFCSGSLTAVTRLSARYKMDLKEVGGGEARTGFVWLMIETGGRLL